MGLSFYGDPFADSAGWTEENEIGRLWKRFEALYAEHRGELPPPATPGWMYELHLWDAETERTGHYEVFIGYPVADARTAPTSLLLKVLPATRVARFTVSGGAIASESSFQEMEAWIASQGLSRRDQWICNLYDESFKGVDNLDESSMDVCIPVE